MIESVEASRESETEEKGKDGQDLYRLWMDAIRLAEKEEEGWRKCADDTVKVYRQEKKNDGESYSSGDRKFNILHANVETLLPALYNSTPIADVRRRYDDKNPTGKQVADILERCLGYSVDSYDFDNRMRHAVSDMELAGRGVTRVRYMPYVGEDDEVSFEEAACEHVAWKHFRRGPGRVWDDTPWIAFELFLSRDELLKLAPKIGGKINLDATMAGADDKKNGENPPEIFKRAKVWEIWDKTQRKVIFFAESYKDGPIREEQDPLGLLEFFPVPRPLYAVETSDSLVPVVPYELYKDQAEELERVSQRIMALTEAMKARGVYDGRAEEISKLSDSDDNTLIAITNVATFADGSKLADKIHYWPIDVIVAALEKLYVAREQIKQTIYEITGIADILRGQTDANETLGAQELKAQWGSLRIQRKQNEIARYARDLFRIKAEIIATKFSWETITLMTGLDFPPEAMKQQAAQQAQMQQPGPDGQPQPVPPEIEELLKKPSREEVEQMLRSDAIRGFNIDIESDSTIRADLTRKQQNMNLFLQGTAQYAAAMGPIVMAPQFQALAPAVIEVFSAFARNFKLGKQAEDALDAVADDAKAQMENPQPPPEDPSVQVEKLKAQNEAQKMQAEQAMAKEKHQMEMEMMQAKLAFEERKLQMQEQKMQLDMQMHQQKLAIDQQNAERDAQMQERQASLQMEQSEHEHALGMEASVHKHQAGMEMLDHKVKTQKEAAKAKPKKAA
jgi:hypothetical protein